MEKRYLGALIIAAACMPLNPASLAAQSPTAAPPHAAAPHDWTPPRTPDGQPDLQGYWNSATYTPLERPAEFKDKAFFTAAEAEAFARRRNDALNNQASDDLHYDNAIWQSEKTEKGLSSLRTSLIVDPPDGRIPPLLPEAQKRQADIAAARRAMGGPYDSVQNRPLAERCIVWPHEGPPMLPVGYNSNLQFVQGPGYVVVIEEMIHNTRVIPLDGRPHVGAAIRQYSGDSRGHWDGNTLVVETTNFTGKTQFQKSSAALKVTERFTPIDPQTIRYQFTVEDPSTWARPWTAEYPMRRTNDQIYEYACHEGNYGMANILRAQREAEKAAK
jgi:hypothetical protein